MPHEISRGIFFSEIITVRYNSKELVELDFNMKQASLKSKKYYNLIMQLQNPTFVQPIKLQDA